MPMEEMDRYFSDVATFGDALTKWSTEEDKIANESIRNERDRAEANQHLDMTYLRQCEGICGSMNHR